MFTPLPFLCTEAMNPSPKTFLPTRCRGFRDRRADGVSHSRPTMEAQWGASPVIRARSPTLSKTLAKGSFSGSPTRPNEGMLFVFPARSKITAVDEAPLIPLSVAFLDAQGKIVSISEDRLRRRVAWRRGPAKYSLEMSSAGSAPEKCLKAGTRSPAWPRRGGALNGEQRRTPGPSGFFSGLRRLAEVHRAMRTAAMKYSIGIEATY